MKWGGFRSTNLVDDALLIATVETGVPVIALRRRPRGRRDRPAAVAARASGWAARAGRSSERQIVVADEERSLAVLFDEVAEERGVSWETERMVLAALEVKGVPRISVEEALWMASEVLQTAD